MNDKQKKALSEYLDRIEGHTREPFRPSLGDRREEPTYEGWIFGKNGFKIYMGIEADGGRHT